MIKLQFIGSGDAFGSGGRLQTCLLLDTPHGRSLIDCGASSLSGLKAADIDPSVIGWVLLSHLHGDHFGGLPFLILDGQFGRRERPLVVAGPPGVRQRVEAAMEVFFPGSSTVARRFPVSFAEFQDRVRVDVGPLAVTPFTVHHAAGAPSFALRIECEGKSIAYSGDTEWTDSLIGASRGVDLFICEAYFFERKVKYHLDYQTLRRHLQEIDCRRIMLTHMSQDMLNRLADLELEGASDGSIVTL